ncbi:MAG: hypothetical protein IKJ74_03665 [Clostridia bacterium]|nr:hypothetical protein [Clostridia bacterium]
MEAGFSRVDITPPLGTPLTGYYKSRYADGMLDPLELNAVALSDGAKKLLLICTDLILIDEASSTEIRERIARATGVEKDGIMIHCLHQHTAPHVGKGECIPLIDYLKDTAYLDLLYRKFCDAAVMAIADLRPAKPGYGVTETPEPLSFIRRFRMKDGSTRTNPGRMNPDVVEPIGQADNSVRLIKFERDGADDIAIVSFSTHQDTISGTKYSADWGGALRRQMEEKKEGVKVAVVSGFQGDVNHVNVFRPAETAPDAPRTHYLYMGKILSDTALSLWEKTLPVPGNTLWSKVVTRFVPTNMIGLEKAAESWEIYEKSINRTLGYKLEMGEKADMGRMGTLPKAPICQTLVVSFFGIGGIGILGVGGEPFTHYARFAREKAGEKFLMTACLVNGGEAYFPTKEAYAEGGYEARTSRMSAECAPMLEEVIEEIINEYNTVQ